MTGQTQFYDEKANFYFEGEDRHYDDAYLNQVYEVAGRALHEETHSYVSFKYGFQKLEEANAYFDEMKKTFPLSKITIYKKTWQEQRHYG